MIDNIKIFLHPNKITNPFKIVWEIDTEKIVCDDTDLTYLHTI